MLMIPLTRLEREGSLEILAEIPPDDPTWDGTGLRLSTSLTVTGTVLWLDSGEVLARLRIRGRLAQECRRCLEPVSVPVDERLELLYLQARSEGAGEGDDGESRVLPEGASELDLWEAIREEMILSQSPFALCRPDCRGLCPGCGVNLNEESCQCSSEEGDPRWNVLRALREERE